MPKIVIPARNITNAVDQWETVPVTFEVGVYATYYRRLVTRDNANAIVGTPGQFVTVTVQWADLPVNIRNAFTLAAGHGDTL